MKKRWIFLLGVLAGWGLFEAFYSDMVLTRLFGETESEDDSSFDSWTCNKCQWTVVATNKSAEFFIASCAIEHLDEHAKEI